MACVLQIVYSVTGNLERSKRAYFPALLDQNNIWVDTPDNVRNKILDALSKLSVVGKQPVLAQFWATIKAGDTFLLTTASQPYAFNKKDKQLDLYKEKYKQLEAYREGCVYHKLLVHPAKETSFGLPGLAFKEGTPHQSENVLDCPEYERPLFVEKAIFSLKWGSFVVPVFLDNECVGVLEFLMTESKSSYDAEIKEVRKALECANLKSETLEKTSIKKKIESTKKIESSKNKRRRSKSKQYARYNLLASYFGLKKDDAMKNLKNKLHCDIGVEGTFNTACREVGITEWPSIREPIPSNITIPETYFFDMEDLPNDELEGHLKNYEEMFPPE